MLRRMYEKEQLAFNIQKCALLPVRYSSCIHSIAPGYVNSKVVDKVFLHSLRTSQKYHVNLYLMCI